MIDKVLSGFFLVFCLGYLYMAKDFSFGTPGAPKSGFMPIIAGSAASVLATINFIKVMMKKNEQKKVEIDYRKVSLFVLGMVAYLVLMKYLGYALSTFITLVCLLKITDVKGWVKPILISAGTAAGFYLIFAKLLMVAFP